MIKQNTNLNTGQCEIIKTKMKMKKDATEIRHLLELNITSIFKFKIEFLLSK